MQVTKDLSTVGNPAEAGTIAEKILTRQPGSRVIHRSHQLGALRYRRDQPEGQRLECDPGADCCRLVGELADALSRPDA